MYNICKTLQNPRNHRLVLIKYAKTSKYLRNYEQFRRKRTKLLASLQNYLPFRIECTDPSDFLRNHSWFCIKKKNPYLENQTTNGFVEILRNSSRFSMCCAKPCIILRNSHKVSCKNFETLRNLLNLKWFCLETTERFSIY